MKTLKITAKGQITLTKEVLRHLGATPGTQVQMQLLPQGRLEICAVRQIARIDGFIGLLAGKTHKVASLDEIDEATHCGWMGRARC